MRWQAFVGSLQEAPGARHGPLYTDRILKGAKPARFHIAHIDEVIE
jgi:hypothetical protein